SGLYAGLAADPRVLRVLALSGGYSREVACDLLAKDPAMIASFSRALLEGLTADQTDEQFTARLDASVAQIFTAPVAGRPGAGATRGGRAHRPRRTSDPATRRCRCPGGWGRRSGRARRRSR